MNKVIVRIKGGLGNQLFCYAAARRLSLVNNAELVIDDVTGFTRDRLYKRQYMLEWFAILARKATPAERLEPFERSCRGMMKLLSRRKPFMQRNYLEQEGYEFDERLLTLKVKGTLFLDGNWQSEGYFKDVEEIIRQDLQIISPLDTANKNMSDQIRNSNAVALHVRWFDALGDTSNHNLSSGYYRSAITLIESKIKSPRFFLFSDNPKAAFENLDLPKDRVTVVTCNQIDKTVYADLWLMAQCRHFIIANSTFSWWGAWLGTNPEKIVISPADQIRGISWWGFRGLIPEPWIKIPARQKGSE
ncbi:MAG: alpha-1,2-fucosyltransferase [Mobilitalea sp.]